VQYSIRDWKERDFAVLPNPAIEFPAPAAKAATTAPSRLDRWRELLAVFPNWATAGTGFALLVVFLGLGFLALDSGEKPQVVENGDRTPAKTPARSDVSPTVARAAGNSSANAATRAVSAPDQRAEQKNLPPAQTAKLPNDSPASPVRINDNPRPALKSENSDKPVPPKSKTSGPRKTDVKRQAPQLTPYEDEEDETLRLADLFEEIDTK
jgi:hypothetical protein